MTVQLNGLELLGEVDLKLVRQLETHVHPSRGVKRIDILLPSARTTFLDGVVGDPEDVADYLLDDGWPGLAGRVEAGSCPVGYVELIEVTPRLQGRGLGGAMLKRAVNAFQKLGACVVYLHAAPSLGKVKALTRFYQSHGFERVRCCEEDVHSVFGRKLS